MISKPESTIKENFSQDDGLQATPVILPVIPASVEMHGKISLPGIQQPFVIGAVEAPVGLVPRVSSVLTGQDRWGTVKARWGVGRMNYTVEPGLYALGTPDRESQVLVTANYKMSFDRLREAIPGRDAWILVLDTKGINVWCAAGKGTFGTEELVRRIMTSGLDKIVSHRKLILPQLSAPGVAAHLVKRFSGFKVNYGPIRAADIPAYLDKGLKATPSMRRKTFTPRERLALIPIELVAAFKAVLLIMLLFFLAGGLGGPGGYWTNAMNYGLFAAVGILAAVISGAVATPLLLPLLPGRAFSVKGCIAGAVAAITLLVMRSPDLAFWPGRLEATGWLLIIPALSAYLAMNFTGASTYTSLSGVKKEMRFALPLEIGAGASGAVIWLASRFLA